MDLTNPEQFILLIVIIPAWFSFILGAFIGLSVL